MPKPNKVTRLIASSTKSLIEELHHRQEHLADTTAAIVDEYWKRLARAIADNVPPDQLVIVSRLAHQQMARDIKAEFTKDLTGLINYTQQRAALNVLAALPEDWVEALLDKAKIVPTLTTQVAKKKVLLQTPLFTTRQVHPGHIVKNVISDTTHLGNPAQITNTINLMRTAGKNSQEIARAVKPMVYGVKSTVRRVVRDSGQFATTAVNLGTWNAVNNEAGGDFIIGYEVHAVPRTKYSRIEHLERSGTIYYFKPRGNQKGLDECPQPPYDKENGHFVLKHNCRCWISPVFATQYQPVKKVA